MVGHMEWLVDLIAIQHVKSIGRNVDSHPGLLRNHPFPFWAISEDWKDNTLCPMAFSLSQLLNFESGKNELNTGQRSGTIGKAQGKRSVLTDNDY